MEQVKGTFQDMLEIAGLPKYERQALSTLTIHGKSTAEDVIGRTDIPRGKVYDTLKDLESKGYAYCEDESARPKLYVAARPEVIQHHLTEGFREIEKLGEGIGAELTELYEAGLQTTVEEDPSRYVTSHNKEAGIASALYKALSQADEVLVVGRDFAWLREPHGIEEVVQKKASSGTVKLLSTLDSDAPQVQQVVAELHTEGMEIKAGASFEGKYVVVDEETVLMAVRRKNPKATEPNFILTRVNSKEFATDLARAFRDAWMDASRVET